MGVRAKQRLLIADDNVDLAENLKEILEDEGYAVSVVPAGAEALEALRGQHFDLVLTDMRMPGLSGMDVLQAVRREFPGVPVALMTAYTHDDVLEEARRGGALGILSKPVPFDRLLQIVRLALRPEVRVLLVEDEPSLRADLQEVLGGQGVLTFSCATMEEARRMLAGASPDVAVLDRRLPDGDGLGLAEELIEPSPPRVPVILISGGTVEPPEVERLRRVGPVECLEKPFSPQALLERIGRLKSPPRR